MTETYCNNCGHRNPSGANFCSSCGAVLETSADGPTTITFFPTEPTDPAQPTTGESPAVGAPGVGTVEVPPGSAALVVRRGPNVGSRYLIDTDVTTIGRHPDSEIFLDDVTVSRRHAEVHVVGGGHEVRDVGSLNGTYLNRRRVESAGLRSGDELQIGTFKLVYLAAGEA